MCLNDRNRRERQNVCMALPSFKCPLDLVIVRLSFLARQIRLRFVATGGTDVSTPKGTNSFQDRRQQTITCSSCALARISAILSGECTRDIDPRLGAGSEGSADTIRSTGLARMEGKGAAVDGGFSVIFVLGRSTAVQVEVVPHAVGFNLVPGVFHDHVPILDDGLADLMSVSNKKRSEAQKGCVSCSYIVGNRFPGVVAAHARRV